MVDLPTSFQQYQPDPSEQRSEFSMLPPGNYIAHAIEAKKREFDAADPRSETNFELNVTYEILDGPHQNRKLWHTFVLQSQSQGQMKVGAQQLADMFAAAGHVGPRASFDPVLFKPVRINVKAFPAGTVEKTYTYQKDTNKIAGFYPANSAPPAQRQQPAYQAPPQQPQAPSGVPKAGVPSWLARK